MSKMIVERCNRSTLIETEEGRLCRQYHDTDAVSDTFPVHVDASGIRRCSGNRRIDALREGTFRGGDSNACGGAPPPHIRNTLAIVCRRPRNIHTVADHLGVVTNTAWSYVCRTVEVWPTSYEYASRLVDPDLLACVRNETDLRGSLRDLMGRLPACAYHALRENADRYAHLRLARICAEAERKNRVP